MGKLLNIKSVRKETDSIAYVFVDGKFIASASAAKKDLAKLEAAKIALDTLAPLLPPTSMRPSITDMQLRAKQKLNELCQNKKWPKPEYSDPIMCRSFALSLKEEALEWYNTLPPNTVDCFAIVESFFRRQYASNQKQDVTPANLVNTGERRNLQNSINVMVKFSFI
ncbi:hypothetical protein VIGAN_UM112700 [Vigna angularis var. angularis]|uniref:DRBM domain-containing protein n=1 Tax=Vigna angularis var. angularis TaxID=157739 RepID=A0A0S3TEQ5_PHAAN|nr:hypothetical protein VIGAN_UM112700 [Vigna angularis var. angularis]